MWYVSLILSPTFKKYISKVVSSGGVEGQQRTVKDTGHGVWTPWKIEIMAGPEADAQFHFTGIKKYFNSYTLTGRMNCVLVKCRKRLPWWLKWWRICLQCRRHGFNLLEEEIATDSSIRPWETHGQRNLAEHALACTHVHACTYMHTHIWRYCFDSLILKLL